MRSSIHHLLEERAGSSADSPALTFKNTTHDYAGVWREARGVAGALEHLGVARGERVALFLDKRPEFVFAMFGASMVGAVFVPVNPVLKGPQVAYILGDCGVSVLVTTRQRWEGLRHHLSEYAGLRHVLLVDGGGGDASLVVAVHDLHEVCVVAPEPTPVDGVVDLDMAAILYTSGSTGRPKGVVLSHRNLIVGAESVSSYLGNTADDVILSLLPLSFDAGLSQVTTAFAAGAQVVLVNYLVPTDVPRLCARHGVTGLTCVPPLWIQLTSVAWPPEATARLRYFANTGGRMPRATLDKLRAIFPQAAPYLMYGLTEAFRSTYLDPAEVDRRPDSIGKAIPNAEVLVVRPDGTRCGPGEEGELVHRGPLVALGYWGDAARSAERFKPAPGTDAGWRAPEMAVWSGDRVVTDDDGFLYFVGRNDEMIKSSGYRVSPTEVEEVAYSSGLVSDAVALGLPDEQLGQRIVLVVSPVADGFDIDELSRVLRRDLPLFMVPADVVVRDELPRSPNGKFDRVLLRKELES